MASMTIIKRKHFVWKISTLNIFQGMTFHVQAEHHRNWSPAWCHESIRSNTFSVGQLGHYSFAREDEKWVNLISQCLPIGDCFTFFCHACLLLISSTYNYIRWLIICIDTFFINFVYHMELMCICRESIQDPGNMN